MEFNPLPDLLNTGFTIIEIGMFYGGKKKKMHIPDFFEQHCHGYIVEDDDDFSHFKNLLSSSNLHKNINFTSQRTIDEF